MRRLLAALAAACALGAAAAPVALAAPTLDVGIADDRILLDGTDADAAAAALRWKALGIDTVRIQARWLDWVAEPLSRRVPPGFDRRDPDSPGYHWGRLDRAVGIARGAGLRILLQVTGAGPVWASLDPTQDSPRYKPSPAEFGVYASAVARRYGRDVDDYIIWNEPNHELWLQPQNTCSSRGCTPYAPHLFRKLVRAADPAIRAADPGARIMLGGLAPSGTSGRSRNARLRPLAFLRALGCVDARYRPTRSGPCAGFQPASGYGFAYHPHGIKQPPTAHSTHPDDAQLGDLARLTTALDRITAAGGLRSRHPSGRFPLWLDEYGYQTNPPDKILGVPTAAQSTYLQEAAYIAWQNPRVRNLTQYVWRDEPLAASSAGWQSGLLFSNGRAKTALSTFPHPFWAVRLSSTRVRLWGQLRTDRGATARLERRTSTGGWAFLTAVKSDPRGFFHSDLANRSGGTFRFRAGDVISSARTVR